MKFFVIISLLCLAVASLALAEEGPGALGLELSTSSDVIVFGDYEISDYFTINLFFVPSYEADLTLLYAWPVDKKASFGFRQFDFGPGVAFGNGDEALGPNGSYFKRINGIWKFKLALGPVLWKSFALGQYGRRGASDFSLVREQIFFGDFPIGLGGNNAFHEGERPEFFWGAVWELGTIGIAQANKLFVTANLANADELWVAWIAEF